MDLPTKFLLLALGGLFFFSSYLVCHFANPTANFFIKVLVIVSFASGFAGVALLPVDLAITTVFEEDQVEGISPNRTYVSWMVIYWSTFLLAWLVLPLIREGIDSGHFTLRTRLQAGCRQAIKGYILLLILGAAMFVFMAVKIRSIHVVPVLMALGNTYGLLMVVLLLGYGLVDLPQKLWRQADPSVELRRTQIVASNLDEHLFESVWTLQDVEALIDSAAQRIGDYEENGRRMLPMDPHYARCVDSLLSLRKSTSVLSPELQRRRTGGGSNRRHDEAVSPDLDGYPSIGYLATLNRRLQHAQNEVLSSEQRWHSIVRKSELYGALAEGTIPRPVRMDVVPADSVGTKLMACLESFSSHLQYIWLFYVRRPWYKLLGASCAVLSIMVLWSEATLSLNFNVSPFALFLRFFDESRGPLFQLSALIPLLYMSICVYSSLFKLNIFGSYRLRGSKLSSGIALVFNAQYLVRLQFPLGYNYLTM
jgi:hypothetical protein